MIEIFHTPLDMPERNVRYDIVRKAPVCTFLARAVETNITSFEDEDDAVAFVGNCETFHGAELSVMEENLDNGDTTCVHWAEWDETLGRYVN